MISILTLASAGEPPREVKPEEFPPLLAATPAVAWVRCLSPRDVDLAWLQGTFSLHPLTIEDCRHPNS